MNYVGGAERMLRALEASGTRGSLVHWELLIVISCVTWSGRGPTLSISAARKGRHVALFLDYLRADLVYVFESNPNMCAILHRRYGARRNLTISETALADHSGVEELTANLGAPGESGLRQRIFSDPDRARVERITVPVAQLDDQVFDGPIRHVKIDVEGGEIGVLRGGRDFLARHRPLLSVEYGRPSYSAYGHTADTLYEEAAMLGYAVCDLFGNIFRSIDEWRACVDRLYWDYLLIPQERLEVTAAAVRRSLAERLRSWADKRDCGRSPGACRCYLRQSSGVSNVLSDPAWDLKVV